MTYSVNIVIRIVTAIILAVFFGNGSVVAFNNINAKWFEDYDEDDPVEVGLYGVFRHMRGISCRKRRRYRL